MSFLSNTFNYFKYSLKNFSNTKKRASKKEFIIFSVITFILITFIPVSIFLLVIPYVTLLIRRAKDMDINPFLLLLLFLPVISLFGLAFLFLFPGKPGSNSYGLAPFYEWEDERHQDTLSKINSKKEEEREIDFNL